MNNGHSPQPSPAETARQKADEASEQRDGALEEIKENFGLLLDLRDRKIRDLEGKLAKGTPEAVTPRLLVVDDAESTGAIMDRYLEGQAVEVVCVAGSQALERLRSETFDTILLEASTLIAADMDGMTFCRELRGKGQGETIVVMSSRPGNRVRNAVEEAGALFLRKPFKRDKVIEIMRSARLRSTT